MAHVTGTLQSGVYVITNVASGNYATVGNALDEESEIEVKATRHGRYYDLMWWTITRLSNHYYTIRTHEHATYARVADSRHGDPVVIGSDEYIWYIPETYVKGEYAISPSSNDMLCWDLEKSDPGMTVKLISGYFHESKWHFTRAADYEHITDYDGY